MAGPGVKSSPEITRTKRIWFEGPLIKQPASQQKEDYPQDYAAQVQIAADAATGGRSWRTWNAQGMTTGLRFVVGSLPEVVEQETDGQPIPTKVNLPVTINGRVFSPRKMSTSGPSTLPQVRQSLAAWRPLLLACSAIRSFPGWKGRSKPHPQGRVVSATVNSLRADPELRFTAADAGTYQVRIWDSKFSGLQHYVYRLTVTAGPWIDSIFPLGGKRGTESEVERAFGVVGVNRREVERRAPVPERAERRTGHVVVGLARHVIDADEAVRIVIGERPEHDRMQHAEHRRVRPQPERERQDDDCGELLRRPQQSHRVGQVSCPALHSYSLQRTPPNGEFRRCVRQPG